MKWSREAEGSTWCYSFSTVSEYSDEENFVSVDGDTVEKENLMEPTVDDEGRSVASVMERKPVGHYSVGYDDDYSYSVWSIMMFI